MVGPAPGDAGLLPLALTRVPDLPRWIDARGMLLSGRATVSGGRRADLSRDGFVIAVRDSALAAVVGRPSPGLIAETLATLPGDVNLLAQMEDAETAAVALPTWRRRVAILHVLPGVMGGESDADPQARVFTRETAPRFEHVPVALKRELDDALAGRTVSRFVPGALPKGIAFVSGVTVPMAAVWAEGRPVSFCYPVWQTETRWDVSIETLEAYRGRGLGARAARAMIRHMRLSGRAPVWGALESNGASRALAARLGFLEAAGLVVFTAE